MADLIIQKGAGFSGKIKLLETSNNCTLNCPESILDAFKNILKDTKVLGASFKNEYTGEIEQFPSDPDLLTARHLQILARNEASNTTGRMNTELYQGLLTDDQIARVRCLVKATVIGGLTQAHHTGGYRSRRSEIDPPVDTIVIDQAGLQWQSDFRNTGGLFFYPDDPVDQNLPEGYVQWQAEMYQAMYAEERPIEPINVMEVSWTVKKEDNISLVVKGKIDLEGVANAIETEFRQALDATVEQGKYLPEKSKPINFKYLKAGMGFFAEGLGENRQPLELARLKGIEQALRKIAKLPKDEQEALLGKVKRLELPYSGNNDPETNQVLKDIEGHAKELGLEWGGTPNEDALAPREGYINSTTNCADPHAPIKNEGSNSESSHPSVDASIGKNSEVDGHNPIVNKDMRLRSSPPCRAVDLEYHLQNYSNYSAKDKQRVAHQFACLVLSTEETSLQDYLKNNHEQLYADVEIQVVQLYEEHIEQPFKAYKAILKEQVQEFDITDNLKEIITDHLEKVTSSEMSCTFGPPVLKKIILQAETMNKALLAANKMKITDKNGAVDQIGACKAKMAAIKNELGKENKNKQTGFAILREDTSSFSSQILRFISNLINLLTPAFFKPSPQLQHEGHNIEKGINKMDERINKFKEMKEEFKQIKPQETKPESEVIEQNNPQITFK